MLFSGISGSYGISFDTDFDPRIIPLLDRGVTYVVGHIRGGGEMVSPHFFYISSHKNEISQERRNLAVWISIIPGTDVVRRWEIPEEDEHVQRFHRMRRESDHDWSYFP